MKLYQINDGHIITDPNIKEIGAIADGWKRACDSTRPKDPTLVDVAFRNGVRRENARTSDLNWNLTGTPVDIIAFRIVPTNMQLEVGDIHKARDGSIHGPLQFCASETYPFTDATLTWTATGTYYITQSSHPRDLVEKIAVVPADTASEWIAWNMDGEPALPKTTVVEVVTRSGKAQVGSNAQPVSKWFWEGCGHPYPILAYRVVPQPAPKPSIEERLARLEARLS